MEQLYTDYLTECEALGKCPLTFEMWQKLLPKKPALADKFPHYYNALPPRVTHVDVYRALDLFRVTRPCVQHAVKKLLCTGARGGKGYRQDIQEAIASLQRDLEMLDEESGLNDE